MTDRASEWIGLPSCGGWHWLERRRDGQLRMAYFDRIGAGWRVADSAGRTVLQSPAKVARLFTHLAAVPQPTTPAEQLKGRDE